MIATGSKNIVANTDPPRSPMMPFTEAAGNRDQHMAAMEYHAKGIQMASKSTKLGPGVKRKLATLHEEAMVAHKAAAERPMSWDSLGNASIAAAHAKDAMSLSKFAQYKSKAANTAQMAAKASVSK